MRRIALLCLIVLLVIPLGCFTHHHTIGSGPHSGQKEYHVQWYILWGILPLGDEKDGGQIAGTPNCRITSQFTPIDVIINFFTGAVTIHRRTIIIEK